MGVAAGDPGSPVFVLTSDVDWASDDCIEDLFAAVQGFGIKPVFMATGKSAVLDRLLREEQIEVGLHPNFLSGSSHGTDVDSIIGHLTDLYPRAETFRSHCFVDSSPITEAFAARGFRYDSNLSLHMQPHLGPLRHSSGLVRFPVFWEDDVHWTWYGGKWDLDGLFGEFLTPGLKILNVHPFNFALNVPDEAFYRASKSRVPRLGGAEMRNLRHASSGTRTFVLELLRRLVRCGTPFRTLSEVYRMSFPSRSAI